MNLEERYFMRIFVQLPIALTILMFLSPAAHAQMGRWYFTADAGGNLTSDTDLKNFFGEPLAANSKVKFDPGVRFGVGAGYKVTDWLGTEIQSGFYANEIKSITDASRVDAVFSNVPLIANVRLECPCWSFVRPYCGGGAGVAFPVLDADHIEIGGTSMHGSEVDEVFAYQAFAGIRFKINDQMGLSLEYRYFHSDSAEWKAEFSEGTSSDKMRFGATETHSLSIAFDFRF